MAPRLWLHLSWCCLWITLKPLMQIELYKAPLGYCPLSLSLFTLLRRFVNIINKSLYHRPCSVIAHTHDQHVSLFHKEKLFPCLFTLKHYGFMDGGRCTCGQQEQKEEFVWMGPRMVISYYVGCHFGQPWEHDSRKHPTCNMLLQQQ